MDIAEIFEKEYGEHGDQPYGVIQSDFMHRRLDVSITYLTMLSLAILFGSIGNVLIIGAVMVDRGLRRISNIFIVNLAIADLCVSSFVNPFSMLGIIKGELWFEKHYIICNTVACVCLTSCFCSLFSIGTISFNRYIHICHNDLYNRLFTLKSSLFMVTILWTLSFLLEMPNFIGWGDHTYDRKTLNCIWDRTAAFTYSLLFTTIGVAFPVCLISYCYYKVYQYVRRSKIQVMAHSTNTGSNKKNNNERSHSLRLARTLFIIFFIFTLCWIPYAITVSADYKDKLPMHWHLFTVSLAHTNSSLNCFVYGVTNPDFRKAYVKFISLTGCGRLFIKGLFKLFSCIKRVEREDFDTESAERIEYRSDKFQNSTVETIDSEPEKPKNAAFGPYLTVENNLLTTNSTV